MPAKKSLPRWRVLLNRTVYVAIGGGLLWFAVEGGEFGTRELLQQRSRHATLQQDVDQLQRDVDSLQKEKTAVLKNDVVLERIAREQYGMLKGNKEILFWMNDARAEGDSSGKRDTLSGR